MTKMLTYYLAGTVQWLILFGFLAATSSLRKEILISFITFSMGVVIGLIMRDRFSTKPWLIAFVPILHLLIGFF